MAKSLKLINFLPRLWIHILTDVLFLVRLAGFRLHIVRVKS